MNYEPENKSTGKGKGLLIVLVVILLITNTVSLYLIIDKKTGLEETSKELQEQIDKFEELKGAFEGQQQDLKKMGMSNDSLNSQLKGINEDLTLLKSFRNKSFSLEQQQEFQGKADNLSIILKMRDTEIAELKEQNKVLFEENTELKFNKNTLKDSIGDLLVYKDKLTDRINLAAKLTAQNIDVTVINSSGKEREGGIYKSSRIDKIKIGFTLAKNEVAKKENKTVYIRVIEPEGSALYDTESGSGIFNYSGKEIFYTAKRTVYFDNNLPGVSVIYDKGIDFKKGKHTIEVYAENFLIGKGSFEVR